LENICVINGEDVGISPLSLKSVWQTSDRRWRDFIKNSQQVRHPNQNRCLVGRRLNAVLVDLAL